MITSITDTLTFRALSSHGRSAGNHTVRVRYLATDPRTHPPRTDSTQTDSPQTDAAVTGVRVAYSISRRVGSAAVRNRLRRQFREIVRRARVDGLLAPGAYLLVAQPAAPSRAFRELQPAVTEMLLAAASSGDRQ